MTAVISPSGAVLHHRAQWTTTPSEEVDAKAVRILLKKECRVEENRQFLRHRNIRAFLRAISHTAGGGVDYKHGAVKGKRNDPWRFSDFSTHPGAGEDGVTTAAGLYQISLEVWRDNGAKMGLADFTQETQDLIAVELLRCMGVLDKLQVGDAGAVLAQASMHWPSLPKTPLDPTYDSFIERYQYYGSKLS